MLFECLYIFAIISKSFFFRTKVATKSNLSFRESPCKGDEGDKSGEVEIGTLSISHAVTFLQACPISAFLLGKCINGAKGLKFDWFRLKHFMMLQIFFFNYSRLSNFIFLLFFIFWSIWFMRQCLKVYQLDLLVKSWERIRPKGFDIETIDCIVELRIKNTFRVMLTFVWICFQPLHHDATINIYFNSSLLEMKWGKKLKKLLKSSHFFIMIQIITSFCCFDEKLKNNNNIRFFTLQNFTFYLAGNGSWVVNTIYYKTIHGLVYHYRLHTIYLALWCISHWDRESFKIKIIS